MSVVFTTMAVALGFGRHTVYIPAANLPMLRVDVFVVFIFGTLCSGFARVSIACLLLQVTRNMRRAWRASIIGIIVLQALMMALYVITQLVQCSSIVGTSSSFGTRCLPASQVQGFTYAQISM